MTIPIQLKLYQWLIYMIFQQKQNLTLFSQTDSHDNLLGGTKKQGLATCS